MKLKELIKEYTNFKFNEITIIDVKNSASYYNFKFPKKLLDRKVKSFYIVNYELIIRIY